MERELTTITGQGAVVKPHLKRYHFQRHCAVKGRGLPMERQIQWILLLTAREGNVFTDVCHSVHNRPRVYSVTTHPCCGAVSTDPT